MRVLDADQGNEYQAHQGRDIEDLRAWVSQRIHIPNGDQVLLDQNGGPISAAALVQCDLVYVYDKRRLNNDVESANVSTIPAGESVTEFIQSNVLSTSFDVSGLESRSRWCSHINTLLRRVHEETKALLNSASIIHDGRNAVLQRLSGSFATVQTSCESAISRFDVCMSKVAELQPDPSFEEKLQQVCYPPLLGGTTLLAHAKGRSLQFEYARIAEAQAELEARRKSVEKQFAASQESHCASETACGAETNDSFQSAMTELSDESEGALSEIDTIAQRFIKDLENVNSRGEEGKEKFLERVCASQIEELVPAMQAEKEVIMHALDTSQSIRMRAIAESRRTLAQVSKCHTSLLSTKHMVSAFAAGIDRLADAVQRYREYQDIPLEYAKALVENARRLQYNRSIEQIRAETETRIKSMRAQEDRRRLSWNGKVLEDSVSAEGSASTNGVELPGLLTALDKLYIFPQFQSRLDDLKDDANLLLGNPSPSESDGGHSNESAISMSSNTGIEATHGGQTIHGSDSYISNNEKLQAYETRIRRLESMLHRRLSNPYGSPSSIRDRHSSFSVDTTAVPLSLIRSLSNRPESSDNTSLVSDKSQLLAKVKQLETERGSEQRDFQKAQKSYEDQLSTLRSEMTEMTNMRDRMQQSFQERHDQMVAQVQSLQSELDAVQHDNLASQRSDTREVSESHEESDKEQLIRLQQQVDSLLSAVSVPVTSNEETLGSEGRLAMFGEIVANVQKQGMDRGERMLEALHVTAVTLSILEDLQLESEMVSAEGSGEVKPRVSDLLHALCSTWRAGFSQEEEGAWWTQIQQCLGRTEIGRYAENIISQLRKTESLAKKYQKDSTKYRERSLLASKEMSERIAYRSFRPGALALFLPTRNQGMRSNPWAAFNVGAPHYFLRDRPARREWLVARIIGLEERVADASRPDENIYQLNEGVKWWIVDIEERRPSRSTSNVST